jgi:hypothetical protein
MKGIAAYGYDWADGRGRPLGATSAAELAAQHRATVSWEETSASAWFRYTSGGTAHTVWFENAEAMASKVQLAREAGARGRPAGQAKRRDQSSEHDKRAADKHIRWMHWQGRSRREEVAGWSR